MIIDFKSSANQKSIASARSQIKDAANLRKLDAFLAKYNNYDFSNTEQAKEAAVCCEHCCEHIEVTANGVGT